MDQGRQQGKDGNKRKQNAQPDQRQRGQGRKHVAEQQRRQEAQRHPMFGQPQDAGLLIIGRLYASHRFAQMVRGEQRQQQEDGKGSDFRWW